ncbi:MAG: PEP-CTERM sorting domain-containing protein [Desulfuromonadaceae bacterium]|nr:PEP-CTERM sorting domain-containing protein [Desulfuromonadaceae bacterium]MDD5104703.1 PEP-CTERM sorting domain-containing protein [Desulfuromonadaceae bacterium]
MFNRLLILIALLICSIATGATTEAQASQDYNFSFNFNGWDLFTGSFTGDANGNVINNLSNISVDQFDGPIYNFGANHVAGGAVASFDGFQNYFYFTESPQGNNWGNEDNLWFDSSYISTIGAGWYSSYWYGGTYDECGDYASLASWSVTPINPPTSEPAAGAAPVPEPGTLALLGIGMGSLAIYGKRRKNQQA